jgi:hypothetical protein
MWAAWGGAPLFIPTSMRNKEIYYNTSRNKKNPVEITKKSLGSLIRKLNTSENCPSRNFDFQGTGACHWKL